MDGALFHCVKMKSIPDGSAAVAVTVDSNGAIYQARMVAGSAGIHVISSRGVLDSGEPRGYITRPTRKPIPQYTEREPEPEYGLGSLQPVSGSWMYKVIEDQEGDTTGAEQLRICLGGRRNLDVKNPGKSEAIQSASAGKENITLGGIGQGA